MCGIAGVRWSITRPSEASTVVDRMALAIRHRGPDSDGRSSTEFAEVAFKRLSIIDLATGDQPLKNEDGSVECFLNGEIYNYVTLRDELLSLGHTFHTSSDTEVLPHLYEEYGTAMFAKLNGMFVICLIDHSKQEVLLARDQFGVKQMYYTETPQGVVFGSEMKAILASGMMDAEVDESMILPYLMLFYCPEPHTLVRGVKKLPQGSWMKLANGRRPEISRYYELPTEPRVMRLSSKEAADRTKRLLWQSVERQLQADVPVGISLSGGVDSSAIAYAASQGRAGGTAPIALTIHWPDTDPAEILCSKDLCGQLGIEHKIIEAPAGSLERELPLLGWISDEPVADPATYSQFCVARVAAEHVKVLLSGAGGDELFGGYGSYLLSRKNATWQALPKLMQRGLYPLLAKTWMDEESLEAMIAYGDSRLLWHCKVHSNLSLDEQELLRQNPTGSPSPFENFRRLFQRYQKYDTANQQMLVDLETYLPEQILTMMDRSTMAASIEGRVPFLDIPLLEFAFSLKGTAKMGRPAIGKRLLKDAIAGGVPRGILDRKKAGMPSPFGSFIARNVRMLRAILLAPDSYVRTILPEAWLRELVGNETSAMTSYRVLYSLLILEVWHRLFIRNKWFTKPDMDASELFELSPRTLVAS
jgi:asparagine synthase (glutamine-hydrolysing)